MTRRILTHLQAEDYQHPFDRKALGTLEKTPGLSLLLKKISEYGIDRLLRLQAMGNEFQVTSRNFPKLYDAFIETCEVLNVSPMPELYLYRGTGHISTYAIGVEKPLVGINLETMEWLSYEELLFVLGHELSRIKERYLTYQQLALVMPLIKNLINSTTFGVGGLAANGLEVALYNWIVMTKFTADRAGLLACQDKNVAITALIKLGGLRDQYLTPEVTQDFIAQSRKFSIQDLDRLDQVTKILSFMEHRLPWMIMRSSELLKWIDVGMYEQCLQPQHSMPSNELLQPHQPLSSNSSECSEHFKPDGENVQKPENSENWDFLRSW